MMEIIKGNSPDYMIPRDFLPIISDVIGSIRKKKQIVKTTVKIIQSASDVINDQEKPTIVINHNIVISGIEPTMKNDSPITESIKSGLEPYMEGKLAIIDAIKPDTQPSTLTNSIPWYIKTGIIATCVLVATIVVTSFFVSRGSLLFFSMNCIAGCLAIVTCIMILIHNR